MIEPLLYLVYSAVGIGVSRTFINSSIYFTRTMMYSGLRNYQNIYCFRFLIDFLYWSLASLWSSIVPKTAKKSSTSPLKVQMDDIYAGRLKHLPHPPHPWWQLLTQRPPRPLPWTRLLVLDSLVVSWPRVVVVSPSPPFLTMDSGSIYVSGVEIFSF